MRPILQVEPQLMVELLPGAGRKSVEQLFRKAVGEHYDVVVADLPDTDKRIFGRDYLVVVRNRHDQTPRLTMLVVM